MAKQNLRQVHNRYIEEILGLTNSSEQSESNGQLSPDTHKSFTHTYASKKLFSLLKNPKQDYVEKSKTGMYPSISKCNAKRCNCCMHLCTNSTVTSSVNGRKFSVVNNSDLD